MARNTIFRSALIVTAALVFLAGPAAAQDLNTFDDKLIAQFNPADSPDSIPVGTKITAQNWKQYRKYLTVSVQAFLSGKYFWKMGSGGDNYIEVGPTIPTILPNQIPERHREILRSGAIVEELLKLPSGAYDIRNYGAESHSCDRADPRSLPTSL